VTSILNGQGRWVSIGVALVALTASSPTRVSATEVVDEIHYSYGENADEIVMDWHGAASVIEFGLTTEYGQQATAGLPSATPIDISGPFREAKLTGLQMSTTYHYRIGGGPDNTFRTRPSADFTWVDVGDTGSTICTPWVADTHALIAAQQPSFVTHGGDIAYANVCGVPAVHRYYVDQEAWSHTAAFQVVTGNHEYGAPVAEAPAGTPRESLLNYKGRSYLTHGQAVSNDSATQINHPGCGWETHSSTNTCRGEDWGWFRAGGVLYISYPEPSPNAMSDWKAAAQPLMAQAQSDASIDFVVTYGHRPAYTSLAGGEEATARTALDSLAQLYSPRTSNPAGKYVLNVAHHIHGAEVFGQINGLTHVTNGGGGEGSTTYSSPADPNSVFKTVHPSVTRGDYDAVHHTLHIRVLCGPVFVPKPREPCTYGSTIYSLDFPSAVSPPPPPPGPRQWIGNPGVETDLTGWAGRYGPSPELSVTRSTSDGAHTGSAAVKVQGLSGAVDLKSGFSDSPRWVSSTVAGTTYSGSAWVKPQFAGQVLNLRLREWQGATLVSDKRVFLTATDTSWQQLSAQLVAAQAGSQLAFIVYADDLDAGESFLADDLSLTSPK
jgi:hypothetical protein